MSQTVTALLAKLFLTFVAAYFTLSLFDGNPWTAVLWFSILATAVNYVVGDLIVLPNYGNTTASIGDGVMAALLAYVFALVTGFRVSLNTLVSFAVLVAIVEYFFHQFLKSSDKVAP